jgi:hypothetical protein
MPACCWFCRSSTCSTCPGPRSAPQVREVRQGCPRAGRRGRLKPHGLAPAGLPPARLPPNSLDPSPSTRRSPSWSSSPSRAGDLPARRGSLRRPARPRATRDHHRARARRRNARRPPRRDRVRRARGDLRAPRRSTPTTPPGPLELAHRPPLGRARAHPDAGDTQPPADLFLDVSCELGVLPLVIRGCRINPRRALWSLCKRRAMRAEIRRSGAGREA